MSAQATTLAGLEARLRLVEDELAIRSLAASFSDCVNERDYAGFAQLWSERGIWELGPPLPARAEAVEAIVAMLRRLLGAQQTFMQMTHSGVVSLAGDCATPRFVEREQGRSEASFYDNLAVYIFVGRRKVPCCGVQCTPRIADATDQTLHSTLPCPVIAREILGCGYLNQF